MKIYLICAWYEVGMRTYSFTILDNIRKYAGNDHSYFITLVLKDKPAAYPELAELNDLNIDYLIIGNKYKNIVSKLFPAIYDSYILKRIKEYRPSLTYILFEGVFFKDITHIKKHSKVMFTVHDLIGHEKTISSWKDRWLERTEKSRRKYLKENSDYIITNSESQFKELKNSNTNSSFYIGMPTLVNEHIANGIICPRELPLTKYILFFGRIDKYKGIEKLLKCHQASGIDTVLVIAGAGKIDFEFPKAANIIIINRYIQDTELNFLFSNALVCVLPYESVTQTALISIPYYFKCPVMLSNLPEFTEQSKTSGSLICNFTNSRNYFDQIKKIEENIAFKNNIISRQSTYYITYYNAHSFGKNINEIFNEIEHSIKK